MPTHFEGSEEEVRALNVFIKLMRATDRLNASVHHSLAQHGLTPGQFAVLEALFHLGPMNQRELGAKLLRSPGNITTVLDNLERDGLIRRERGVEDRRCFFVSLTEAGRTLIADIFPAHAARVAASMGALTPEEQEELGRLCRKLGTSLPG